MTATRTQGDFWVVEGGLDEGDRVIVSGIQRVQPGALVRATAVSSNPGTTPQLVQDTDGKRKQ